MKNASKTVGKTGYSAKVLIYVKHTLQNKGLKHVAPNAFYEFSND